MHMNLLLPPELHRRVKSAAALAGVTLRAWVIGVIAAALTGKDNSPKREG